MKFFLSLFASLFLLAPLAQAQNSAKAKSKDRFREKEQSALPTEIVVADAKTFTPLSGATIRILQSTDSGFVDGRRNVYDLQLEQNASGTKLIGKKTSDLGSPDLWTNAAGRAWTEFVAAQKYLVVVSMAGYVDDVQVLVAQTASRPQLRIGLRRTPPCLMRASGKVLTEKFGFSVVGAEVRFVHAVSGQATTLYTDLEGAFDACLPSVGEYTAWVLCEGFKLNSVKLIAEAEVPVKTDVLLKAEFTDANRKEIGFISGTQAFDGLLLLDSLVIEPKSTSMSDNAMRLLNELARLMARYPKAEVNFVAHTDVRGDAQLNQALSDERARNARDYLTVKGIAPHRLRLSGKGESQPRNTCLEGVPCSEPEHQQNSRFEVRLRRERE